MANAVRTVDRDAVIDVVHTTKDAIDTVRGHASEFRYAIVDLVLDISPGSEQWDYTRGTNAFLDWLRSENLLASIRVLVLSQSTSILNNLDSGIAGRVCVHAQLSTLSVEKQMCAHTLNANPLSICRLRAYDVAHNPSMKRLIATLSSCAPFDRSYVLTLPAIPLSRLLRMLVL